MMASNICGFSIRNLQHVNLLAPVILWCLLDFLKICGHIFVWIPAIDDYTSALYSKASTLNKETEGSLKMQVITHENMVSYRTTSPYSQRQKSQNPSNSLPVLIMQCSLQRLIHTG